MKTFIGMNEKSLSNSVHILSDLLSDEMVLYVKTRKFHWNVSGESFMELHKLFEEQYNQLEKSIDEIAERIGKLGHKSIGTMNEFLKQSSIKEHPGKNTTSNATLKELASDHEIIIIQLRKSIEECATKNKDAGTADLLTGILQLHETIVWVLRRYLN